MKKPGRKNRADQTVDKARRDVAKHYDLPLECVKIVLPKSGRKPRTGKTIGQLRADATKGRRKT